MTTEQFFEKFCLSRKSDQLKWEGESHEKASLTGSWNFSKVSPVAIFYSRFGSQLTFENYNLKWNKCQGESNRWLMKYICIYIYIYMYVYVMIFWESPACTHEVLKNPEWMSLFPHLNECENPEWMSHVSHMKESWKCIKLHVWMSHVMHMSWCTF